MENNSFTQNNNAANNTTTNDGVVIVNRKKNKRKRKKNNAKKLHHSFKKNSEKTNHMFNLTMSSWAETYTHAATWQLKHQIAFWKAKAKALECENRVLHDIIRKNYATHIASHSHLASSTESVSEAESEKDQMSCNDLNDEDPELQVSEEFIQFLTENEKYREDARLERERFRGDHKSETEEDKVKRMEAAPSVKSTEENVLELKKLYGDSWQFIAALETSLQCQFISACDKKKPIYWPNIPFNFN